MSSAPPPDDPKTQQITQSFDGPETQPVTIPETALLQAESTLKIDTGVTEPAQNTASTTVMEAAAATTQQDPPTLASEQRPSVLSLLGPTARRSPALPAQVEEKYEVVGELGKGGVGQVLKVRDRDLKREVAMKMLLPTSPGGTSSPSQDALIRFIEEAQATGQLEHPNIVPVHDLGVDREGRVYFTLKYVQGLSLQQVIRGRNDDTADGDVKYREAYSALRMVEILISICQAVAYAHSKGIIHRDLKPANVMLGKYGEVLVMDWGLAKVIGRKPTASATVDNNETIRVTTTRAEDQSQATMEGSVAGTPAYMSPEQAGGKIGELDRRTDIYALGAMLYEVLSGTPPYRGSSALDIVKQVVQGPPAPIRKQKGTHGFTPIPRELAAICERAMARKAGDRYASAQELRNDLQAYLENLPVSAAPDTRVQQFGKWVKRNRRQVQSGLGSAVAALLMVVSLWYAWHTWRVYSLIADGENRLNSAREEFRYKSPAIKVATNEPYGGQAYRIQWLQRATLFRQGLQGAMEPMRRAIDLAPSNTQARALMAESQMELWRLALYEENAELARVTRREVERYAPNPDQYAAELNGYAFAELSFDAPDAEVFLFSFELLNVTGKDGASLPTRLIPIPYDIKEHHADAAFLTAEQTRIRNGEPVKVDRHSIFNLEPTPVGRVGKGSKMQLPSMPPGSYLLLVRAPGRVDTRIPLRLDRLARIHQAYVLPKTEENPAGFFYMAGGDVTVGGDTAGAPARHNIKVAPAWIYHDEMSMGDYEAFLQWLVKNGRTPEARQRLPKDFGSNLATLTADGHLLPAAQGSDAAAFLKSPVRGVSYNDAEAYVAWRAQQDGLPYRLPKDWEWEAACRGTDGRRYSWGDTPGKGLAVVTQGYGDNGNSMSWKWEDYKDESPWGIHNLAGGAAEWTASAYDPTAKPEDPVFGQYAIRGNAWALPPVGLECAFRTSGRPDYFHPTIGFRMALDHPYARTGAGTNPAESHQH